MKISIKKKIHRTYARRTNKDRQRWKVQEIYYLRKYWEK